MSPRFHAAGRRLLMGVALSITVPAATAAEPLDLIGALETGGKVVMLRHTQTAAAEPEVSLHLSGNCQEEQNLDATGQDQARAIAAALKVHGIPIDLVYTSEFCRARDTARLAFGEFETWDALNLMEIQDQGGLPFLVLDIEERMGRFQGDGNLILVSHRSTINTVTYQQTEPGDMVVLEPDGISSVKVLGLLPLEALTNAVGPVP